MYNYFLLAISVLATFGFISVLVESPSENLQFALATLEFDEAFGPIDSVYFDSDDKFSLLGGKIISDDQNSSLLLDGNNDYIILNSQLPEKVNDFSVSVWVKPDYKKGTPSTLSIVSRADAFDLSINNDQITKNTAIFSVYDGIEWHSVSSKSTIPEKWTHISATFSENSITIFVNGIKENSAKTNNYSLTYQNGIVVPKTFDYLYSTKDILVGGFNPSIREISIVQNNFSGLIDDVLIYDRLISSDQISVLKNNRMLDVVKEPTIQTLEILPEKVGIVNQYGFVKDEDNPNDQKIESAAAKGFKVKKSESKKKNFEINAILSCGSELEYRTINGTCNNLENPLYGSAGIPLLRKAPANYTDSKSIPSGESRPKDLIS